MFTDFTHNGKFYRIFYEQQNLVERFIREIIKEAEYQRALSPEVYDTVVDIGANIGLFAIYAYDKAKKIYCVEPFSKNVNNLSKTIVANELTNIALFRYAIMGEKKTGTVLHNSKYSDIQIGKEGDEGAEKVGCITLNQFLDEIKADKVDLLKIDIEGAEAEVFDAPDFNLAAKKIRRIIGETHSTEKQVRHQLENNGFNVNEYKQGHFYAERSV